MSFLIKEIVKSRINQLTPDELIQYGKEYGFTLTIEEANSILHYIQTSNLDLFSYEAIENTHQKIAEITNIQTANKAKNLLQQLIKSYGLESYFN